MFLDSLTTDNDNKVEMNYKILITNIDDAET
jgi:hypothetical protein